LFEQLGDLGMNVEACGRGGEARGERVDLGGVEAGVGVVVCAQRAA
jgi:hypothetical protein